ncbi:MAG: protein-tyrosine-phosphatase [Verrucomicrobiota bacterium]
MPVLFPPLQSYAEARLAEADGMDSQRMERLGQLAAWTASTSPSRLLFICTHNSRRSHLSQLWAQTAAAFHDLAGIQAFSGGTEATACNQRTIRSFRRAGFSVVDSTGGDNPHYLAQFSEALPPLSLWSKPYSDPSNPREGFAAVLTCDHAAQTCPVVTGANQRFSLPYLDPKVADDTASEETTYDERQAQIAREMLFLFSLVKRK